MSNQDEIDRKNNVKKAIIGTALLVPWIIYQLRHVFDKLWLDPWNVVFTLLFIAGIIILATMKRNRQVKLTRTTGTNNTEPRNIKLTKL